MMDEVKESDWDLGNAFMQANQAKSGLIALLSAIAVAVCPLMAMAAEESYQLVSVAADHDGTAKDLQAQITIDAPPHLVWKTLTNYAQMKNIVPGYEKFSVVKANGPTKLLDIAMKVVAFLPTYKYQVQVQEFESARTIKLQRVSGDFKTLSASYKLNPQDGDKKTLLVYNLSVDTGTKIPGSQTILRNTTEKSLKALERHCEQEARRSLIGQR